MIASLAQRLQRLPRNVLMAAVAWITFALLVVISRFDVPPSAENVFNIYREAALRWQAGQDLYPANLYFNYFPQSALFFVPWTWLPFNVGGALWRALNILVFALGVWRISASSDTGTPHARFLVASIFTILLSWSAARYGQLTLTMGGLMMLAAVKVQRGALWRAAGFCTIAVALKPPAIALMLVLVAVYPPLLWRCAIMIASLSVLPFLSQEYDYVVRQYAAVPEMLQVRAVGRVTGVFHGAFEFFTTLGWNATALQQTLVRGAAALLVLALCWRVRWHPPRSGVAFSLYALTTCYILLLGYGTERNTYALMGPIVGLFAADAWREKDRYLQSLTVGLTVASLLSYTLLKAYPGTPLSMTKVIAGFVLFGWATRAVLARRPTDS